MRRDRFYIGIAIFMVVVVAVFITLSILGQQKRDAAVRELQSRVAEIKIRSHSQHNKDAASSNRDKASVADKENNDQDSDDEADVAAHKQLADKMNILEESEEWKLFIESLVRIDDGEDTEEDHQRIAALLDANREIIEEIRRMAGKNYDSSHESLQPFIQCARLLATNMMLSATRGDYETLFLDFEAAKALAGSARKNPDLMSQLVSNGIYSILYKCIEENIAGEHLPPDQINELIVTAANATDRERIADAVLLEGDEGIRVFDAVRSGDLTYPAPWNDYGERVPAEDNTSLLFRLYVTLGRPLVDMDAGLYADIMNQADTAMRLPFNEARPILEDLETIEGSVYLHPISSMLVPVFTRYAEHQAFHEAQMGLMQVGLAVEQHHAQHNEYPETLDVIAPGLGGTLPLDPYTGQPFVYKPGDTEFTLYSARGSIVSEEEYGNGLPYTDSNGNIVWRRREE
jgi:hypothetical protein